VASSGKEVAVSAIGALMPVDALGSGGLEHDAEQRGHLSWVDSSCPWCALLPC